MTALPFNNLRVRGVKGLAECDLLRLGRVNVVCGRNNSGKSTLLEGIVTPGKRSPGIVVDSSRAKPIFNALYRTGGWQKESVPDMSFEGRSLLQLILAEVGTPRMMFATDAPVLTRGIQNRFQNSPIGRWAFSPDVQGLFDEWMPNNFTSVLVLPKRRLDTLRAVAAGEDVSPAGAGILNFLFFAKNRPSASVEFGTFSRIAEEFTSISNGFVFSVFLNPGNELALQFARTGGPWVSANDCGLGLQDLLVLLYFSIAPGFAVVAIEEPESHLHPDMQRRLLGFLSRCDDRQFFLSTHSNVFLNNAYVDRVFFTTFSDQVRVSDETSRASMLDDLGYSVADNLVSDVVVLVEGPTDTPIIEELLLKRGVLPKYDVKIWPLGGDIMDQLDLTILTQAYKVVALLDRDPGSSKVRKRFRERCAEASIPLVQLKRYAIENYFTLDALRAVFGVQLSDTVQALDPSKSLESQIAINVKKNNRRLARELRLSDIEGTDLGRFLDTVEGLCAAAESERGTA